LPLGAGNTETCLVELIGATQPQLAAASDNIKNQLEEMAGNVEHALAELRRRPTPARLANPAPVMLRMGLLEIFPPYAADAAERDRRVALTERDRWVAEVLRLLGIRFPSAKKDRGRFRGRSRKRET